MYGFISTCNFCKNLRKKSQLDFRQVNDILLLYEIELLENEQFAIEQYIAKQKPTEKQVISNVQPTKHRAQLPRLPRL